MELLFVLFEMANCTCVVVSHITSGKVLNCVVYVLIEFVCAIWSDIHELFVKCFCFVSVSDGHFSLKQMLLFYCVFFVDSFPTGSVDCFCDQFCQDVVSSCLFHVYVYVCLM